MVVSKGQKQPKLKKPAVKQASSAISAKSAKSAAVAASATRVRASQDRIKERAFQIYEKRGSEHGHDMQDWLSAERQILAR